MATWVLEEDVLSDGDRLLAAAVRAAGADVLSWQDVWWSDRAWPRPEGPVIFHGSLGNADRLAREHVWTPGAFCSTEEFACSRWWPAMAEHLLTPRFALTTVADIVSDGPPAEFGERIFVRPDSPLKPFSGRVLDRDRVTLAALDHGFYYDDVSLAIVVAPAVPVDSEWRFVVVGQDVVAGSAYTPSGRAAGAVVAAGEAAWRYAADLARQLTPPDPIFVLDICRAADGFHLLELNPFSGADLYGCDRHAAVDAVHDYVVQHPPA
jgi:hypothetical protein